MPLDWPPSLTLETESVLRLFTGENFYTSADAAIREAVLNSIDAIGRRKDTEPDIEPIIYIEFDREEQTIIISDDGDGMDQNDLTDLFSKVGASASRLFSDGKQYRAIGEFGIGALSYFLVCDKYQIQTFKKGSEPIGLEFSKSMLDGRTTAKDCNPNRVDIGTTIIMFVNSLEVLEMTIKKFSHWIRNVDGLTGRILPEGDELKQGGLSRQVRQIAPANPPPWIEDSNLGPPEKLDIWDSYDGKGRVDVLYRGVFVERIELGQLWGLEGAVHVDPKHFRPKLDREGFVGNALKEEITPFLKSVHPQILEKAVECIRELLKSRDDWSLDKAITLWLAVPRTPDYSAAAQLWDEEFRNRKAFLLRSQNAEREVSISEIINLNADEIYLEPDQTDQSNPVIGQAIRVLRAREEVVIRGIQRDRGYLSTVSIPSNYSSWLLLHTFRSELPKIIMIQDVANNLVRQESIADIYSVNPLVKLVELGSGSVPFLAVGNEIWINIEAQAGKSILEEICRRNEGHLGLWVACMMHAPDEGPRLQHVGALLRRHKPDVHRLGLVRRQYLRSLLK